MWAQGLHFLNALIRDPILAVALWRDGVLVNVPRPERFAEELARASREAREEGPRWVELLDGVLTAAPAIRARIEHVSDN